MILPSSLLINNLLPSKPVAISWNYSWPGYCFLFLPNKLLENICFSQPLAHEAVWSCAPKGPRSVTLTSHGTVLRHLGKGRILSGAPPMDTAHSHFTHFLCYRGSVRGQVYVVKTPKTIQTEFTHPRWEEKQNKEHSASQCVIYTSANRMWEDGARPKRDQGSGACGAFFFFGGGR